MTSFFLDFTTSFWNSQITYWVFLVVSFMTMIMHVFRLELISFLLNLLPLLSMSPVTGTVSQLSSLLITWALSRFPLFTNFLPYPANGKVWGYERRG